MTKVCQECEYVVPSLEQQQEPPGVPENCPQCGGLGTVVDEPEALNEKADEDAE
ncbi:MAG TPA: hypothetical protein VL283_04530 [Candidatus Baltobacteraceae bacterium]|nr:hypothetical protein [Candidatus Baltobacteraceae bacterium]